MAALPAVDRDDDAAAGGAKGVDDPRDQFGGDGGLVAERDQDRFAPGGSARSPHRTELSMSPSGSGFVTKEKAPLGNPRERPPLRETRSVSRAAATRAPSAPTTTNVRATGLRRISPAMRPITVPPSKGSSSFCAPMRLDWPAARMMAQIVGFLSAAVKLNLRGREPRRRAPPADGDQLGDDARGDLRDGLRADVQADRRVDPVELFLGRVAGFDEVLADQGDFAAAADHADVGGRLANAGGEGGPVVLVAARDDGDERVGGDGERGQFAGDVAAPRDHAGGIERGIGELGPVVQDRDREPDEAGLERQRLADVPAAGDHQQRRRDERLDEDLELRARLRLILDEEFRRLPLERGADGVAAGEADVGGHGILRRATARRLPAQDRFARRSAARRRCGPR